MPQRVIIDTDPGVDDALALLLAFGCPDRLTVEGLTITPGNGKSPKQLAANARLICRLAGRADVPVFLGSADRPARPSPAERPLAKTNAAVQVHGEDGLGGAAAGQGQSAEDWECFRPEPAWEFICTACASAPGEITIVCIGPLTNLARALAARPEIVGLAAGVVLMGGAAHGELRGNRTPTAEANFFDDPAAAQRVLTAGFRELVVADLGVTHQSDLEQLSGACEVGAPGRLANFIRAVSRQYVDTYLNVFRMPVAPAHDVVAVMYLVKPELFTKRSCRLEVETAGELTVGMSVPDWGGKWGLPDNCEVLLSLEAEGFVERFVEAIRLCEANAARAL